jgi:hypothetical protein
VYDNSAVNLSRQSSASSSLPTAQKYGSAKCPRWAFAVLALGLALPTISLVLSRIRFSQDADLTATLIAHARRSVRLMWPVCRSTAIRTARKVRCIYLNTNYLNLYVHDQASFAFTGFESLLSNYQLGYIGAVLTIAELVLTKPKTCVRVKNVGSVAI